MTKFGGKKKSTTYQLATTAIMTALMCVLGPLSIPIGPVPISLTNFVVMLSAFILGLKLGMLSFVLYLVLGAIGLPVFSGFSGGIAKFVGPTGGYLVGFIFIALLCGLSQKAKKYHYTMVVLGALFGNVIDYIIGTAWFVYLMKCDVNYALSICVYPFIIGDIIKIILAIVLGEIIKRRLLKAGLLSNVRDDVIPSINTDKNVFSTDNTSMEITDITEEMTFKDKDNND